ncbi:GGDEF domain-containing phosphodiesterase [Qipengyuania sp. DGS5-3]|uniref:GGDEF domain-containing phosphodiesterase n=1 Tax=Qipengyuania sp. DGS5-3 TaxID=3349632 RepID=UPI0036D3CDF5
MASRAHNLNAGVPDSLTGLADVAQARETIAKWQREWPDVSTRCPLHAMLVDLGRIDTVNVAFGETSGDGALVEVAQRIRHFADDELESSVWLAARVSGGTFLLVAREECSRERWQWLAEALADALAMPISNPGGDSALRLSPRLVLMRALGTTTPETMLDSMAEGARRLRTMAGQRIIWETGEHTKGGRTNQQLEADLLGAIDRDEIEILYQPQFHIDGDRLYGAEALARWRHPQLGLIGAGVLFGIAERIDHVTHLSRHISRRALEAAKAWPKNLRLSINITPEDLATGGFARELVVLIEEAGISPGRITLEITEQVLLSDLDRVGAVLDDLRYKGVAIALDDFGAGFCNFHYLKMLPIDQLKIDYSLVENIHKDQRDLSIFRAITQLAQALEMTVTAEGVETEEQLALVRSEGCESYQGFLKAKPMAAADFLALTKQ